MGAPGFGFRGWSQGLEWVIVERWYATSGAGRSRTPNTS